MSNTTMQKTILLVSNDSSFSDYISAVVKSESQSCNVLIARDRREAITILREQRTVRYVVMSLAIPRIADGYIFLSQAGNKIFPSKKIVVLVQKTSDQVLSSVGLHGVKHIYSTDEMHRVIPKLHSALGATALSLDVDMGKLQEILEEVMGPVASFIFEESYRTCKDISNAVLFVEKIVQEIGDEKCGKQFYTRCYNSGVLFGGTAKVPMAF